MIDRRAVPGLAAGGIGAAIALVTAVTGPAQLGYAAAVCALAAGLWSVVLSDAVREARRDKAQLAHRTGKLEAESERMAARAAQFESEMIKTRADLADAMRQEAAWEMATGQALTDSVGGEDRGDPVIDPTTGFFNERFFMAALDKRVSAARRGLRPLAVALIEVVNGVADRSTGPTRASDAPFVAAALIETLREADTVARLRDGRFAVLLEDTPENGAIWTLERFRRRVVDEEAGHTVWAGLASYPAHAFDAVDLMTQARLALASAKEWRQDRIEVALTPTD